MKKIRSLQHQLLLTLCSATLITAILAASASAYISFRKHQEFQDRILSFTAFEDERLANKPPPLPRDEQIFLQTPQTPQIVPLQNVEDGYHLFKQGDKRYRGYVHTRPDKRRVAALQALENRNWRAIQAALFTAAPLLLLIPILALLTAWILKRSLSAINHVAQALDARAENDTTPITIEQLPLEMHSYTRAINRLLARQTQFMQEQRRFIAAAAHEMRTPLAVLTLQAERLSQQALPLAAQQELSALQTGIQRNRNLLEQLLILARSQDAQIEQGECESNAVFLTVIEQLLPLAEQKNSDIGIAEHSENIKIALPQEVLYTLIKNLADNAIRYSPKGSQIDLCACITGDKIIFNVEDNGNGLNEKEREALIAPFARALGHQTEGSGLGLSIVKALAEKYGGKLYLTPAQHFPNGLRATIEFYQHY